MSGPASLRREERQRLEIDLLEAVRLVSTGLVYRAGGGEGQCSGSFHDRSSRLLCHCDLR